MEAMRLNMNPCLEFKLIVKNYKMQFNETKSYYENNWIEGCFEINNQVVINLELLQVEELFELKKWIEDLLTGEELQPDFVFIDSFVRFQHLIRSKYKYVKFVFDEFDENEPIQFEFRMDEIQAFGNEVARIAKQFPIR
jgi:hypothetical protein